MMERASGLLWFGLLVGLAVESAWAGDLPSWYLEPASDEALLTGRGMAEVGSGGAAAALEQAKREAMRDLSQSLLCRLTSEIIDHQAEQDNAGAVNQFASRTVVESALELVNVRTLQESVGKDMAFVAIAAERDSMARTYRDRTARFFSAAADSFARAGALEAEQDARGALATYEATLADLREARQSLQVYLALNRWADQPAMPAALPDDAEIRQRLQRLAAATPRTLTEIAAALAGSLTASLPPDATPRAWMVLPVEFEHTGFVSDFGHQLSAALSASLAAHPALRITGKTGEATVIVRGRMLREGESFLLILNAEDRAVQHYLEPVTCAAIGKARLEPPDLERLLADKVALHKAMAVPSGLRVEMRTDRMHDGPVTYCFGDEPKLAVRADRACFLRVLYVTAEGKRLLLLDRYSIGAHQANQWVPLPLDLVVCEPAGVEQMLLQAVTAEDDARLPALRVKNESAGDGYVIPVIQETLGEAMSRTRGLMMKTPRHFAELASQWTIFAK